MIETLLQQGWGTAAACLVGAIALLAALRSSLHRVELALREKLALVLAAAGLATAGIASQSLTQQDAASLANDAATAAADHPFAIAGVVFAGALAVVLMALVFWIRFWVRTAIRMAMLGTFLVLTAVWCIARFVLADYFDAWAGTSFGPAAWQAMLDGSGVAFIVLLVWSMIRKRPPRDKGL